METFEHKDTGELKTDADLEQEFVEKSGNKCAAIVKRLSNGELWIITKKWGNPDYVLIFNEVFPDWKLVSD